MEQHIAATVMEMLECPITKERMVRPVRLNCGHVFGEAAILAWLRTNDTCPLCRGHYEHHIADHTLQALLDRVSEIERQQRLESLTREDLQGVCLLLHGYSEAERRELHTRSGRGGRLLNIPRDFSTTFRTVVGHHLTPGTLWNPESGASHYGAFANHYNVAFVRGVMPPLSTEITLVIKKYRVPFRGGCISLLRQLGQEGFFTWDCFETAPGNYIVYLADKTRDGSSVSYGEVTQRDE